MRLIASTLLVIYWTSFLFLLPCCTLAAAAAAAAAASPPNQISQIGPIGWQRSRSASSPKNKAQPPSFEWLAAVDREKGTTHSRETSNILPSTKLGQTTMDREGGGKNVLEMFEEYPKWMCRLPVSFGILRAVKTTTGYDICTQLLPIRLLSFGKAKAAKTSLQGGDERFLGSQMCRVRIPITGGILAYPGKESALQVCLQSNGKGDAKLSTGLVGYRPKLCGECTPINPMRAGFYLGTQSCMHGYIMWRFHRFCRDMAVIKKQWMLSGYFSIDEF